MAPLREWPDVGSVDWKSGAAALAVLGILWGLAKRITKPALRKLVEWCLDERLKKADETAELAEANKDKLEFLEAALLQMAQNLKDWPKLVQAVETSTTVLERIAAELEEVDTDVRKVAEQTARHSGILTDRPWDGLTERRTGHPRRLGSGDNAETGNG